MRTRVLPELERALGPGIRDALARTAALARDDADALDVWADQVWARLVSSGSIRLEDAAGSADAPEGVGLLVAALTEAGPPHRGRGPG